MGRIHPEAPQALFFVAAFSRFDSLLDQVPLLLENDFGPLAFVSERFALRETEFYAPTMGTNLLKQHLVFTTLRPVDWLVTAKHRTNALEDALAARGDFDVPRPLNLDPGYLDTGKLVLASTKGPPHRLYLRDGIYAEVTLRYYARAWHPWHWTYPDYRRPDVLQFFTQARNFFLAHREANTQADASR